MCLFSHHAFPTSTRVHRKLMQAGSLALYEARNGLTLFTQIYPRSRSTVTENQ